ncbi:MAG: SH3 domain-containing protein [Pseudonocardiaceae bacterium]
MATTKKQRYVVGGVVVVGAFLLFAAHNDQGCTVTVTADQLKVRSSPDNNAAVVQTFTKGEVVSADRTILNGFRQLTPGHWAAREYLNPTPGSDCD